MAAVVRVRLVASQPQQQQRQQQSLPAVHLRLHLHQLELGVVLRRQVALPEVRQGEHRLPDRRRLPLGSAGDAQPAERVGLPRPLVLRSVRARLQQRRRQAAALHQHLR